jgi:hypothetical protein
VPVVPPPELVPVVPALALAAATSASLIPNFALASAICVGVGLPFKKAIMLL